MSWRSLGIAVVFAVVVLVVHTSIIGQSGFFRPRFFLPLFIGVVVLNARRFRFRLFDGVTILLTGLLLDMYSAYGYGTLTIALGVSLAGTAVIIRTLFGRRSLLSFVVSMILSVMLFWIVVWGVSQLSAAFGSADLALTLTGARLLLIGEMILFHIVLGVLVRFVFNRNDTRYSVMPIGYGS